MEIAKLGGWELVCEDILEGWELVDLGEAKALMGKDVAHGMQKIK